MKTSLASNVRHSWSFLSSCLYGVPPTPSLFPIRPPAIAFNWGWFRNPITLRGRPNFLKGKGIQKKYNSTEERQ